MYTLPQELYSSKNKEAVLEIIEAENTAEALTRKAEEYRKIAKDKALQVLSGKYNHLDFL
jgi:hypothetical protein